MTDLNQSIRLHSGADHPTDPEPKTSGLWLYAIAIAGLGIVAGVVWGLFFA